MSIRQGGARDISTNGHCSEPLETKSFLSWNCFFLTPKILRYERRPTYAEKGNPVNGDLWRLNASIPCVQRSSPKETEPKSD